MHLCIDVDRSTASTYIRIRGVPQLIEVQDLKMFEQSKGYWLSIVNRLE